MAIELTPTGIFSSEYEYGADLSEGVTSTNPGIFIPLSNIEGLDATEAGEVTGDHRKLLWGLLEQYYQTIQATDSDDRPEKMSISRSGLTIVDDDTARKSYTITFDYDISGFDVEDEEE